MKKRLIIIMMIIICILGLGYNLFLQNQDNDDAFKIYNIGDKVTVELSQNIKGDFYVLKKSSSSEENVTLFAEKNIGTSAFNNDYSDGNEYNGSLIENKLNDLTKLWTNVIEKRLITVEEIENTGLTERITENRCIQDDCPQEYTYIKKNSFLLYPLSNDESLNEIYWTMTKVDSSDNTTGNTNRYVYYVDLSGCIDNHIVGYMTGSQWNEDGTFFENFGIRPVITISKEYIND